ncbi:unnamed protein product (macronuclear) [Paramecium tetraurelia]|uniref:Protein kinase domain-containing protein n=1 Tax=Paramecium tetraurelia TaxID=5888 RepID=A0BFR1_PARTE|nr:uncharacterized protein GSPATT00028413001 [Paramecium tetraurelia]CAK57378.1 unnamed protein product [Paramecium tetraurelia]|eukprot:XP_001424776.1 hypothetical protein (macronuclear) [Paramecium tetraurelia strain d4-2]
MFETDIPNEENLKSPISSIKPKFRSIHKTQDDNDEVNENIQNAQHQLELSRSLNVKDVIGVIRVQTKINRWVGIQIRHPYITCGWLLSEVIRKFSQLELNYDPFDIVGFTTHNIHLDYQLSCLHLILPNLNGTLLVPLIRKGLKEPINIEWFEIIKKIGAGSFSVVYLVRNKENGQFYAMKVTDKQLMMENKKEELIINEKEILIQLNHRRIINLHASFQSKTKLYFVFDYCPGGELFYHLRNQKRFNEEQAKWLFLQIVDGIQYLHSKNIIYRDLKPENILIDLDGYPKLVDFGLSKIVEDQEDLNFSFCGSLEYMAPEMLELKGHNYSLDYYQLGILLYEMVAGIPPFFAKTRQEMVKNILTKKINFPSFFSKNLVDLISNLCNKNVEERLCGKKILQHPWVSGFIKKMPIKYKLDCFHIDKLFITQQSLNIESGPRCIVEEYNLQTMSQSVKDEEWHSFEKFQTFYYKKQ